MTIADMIRAREALRSRINDSLDMASIRAITARCDLLTKAINARQDANRMNEIADRLAVQAEEFA